MRLKEQQSFPFSHVPFPAPEVLQWGPCPCRQENSRDHIPVPGSCMLEKRGRRCLWGGRSWWGCVVVDGEQGAGARESQPVPAPVQHSPQRHGEGARALVLVSGKEGALLSGGTNAVLMVCLGDCVSFFPCWMWDWKAGAVATSIRIV